ncbi:MAG: peptidoglycan-binding protein [Rhodospirillaceae bacterium]|nr:peptidoglycan-binding protein [Rhodospirillaceae bacterium]
MLTFTRIRRLGLTTVTATLLFGATPIAIAHAQMPSAPAASTVLPRSTVLSLQEALSKQGAVIKVDGVLGNETRAAIRQFQSQHHLPVTGEPDRATLDKLGVLDRSGAAQAQMAQPRMAMPGQATPQAGGMQGGMMRGGMMGGEMMKHHEMMQKQMQSMMSMMQEMMKRMEAMQSQMQMHPKSN